MTVSVVQVAGRRATGRRPGLNGQAARPGRPGQARQGRLRLTLRGRVVLAVTAMLLAGLGVVGGYAAAAHAAPGSPTMTVVVAPGQTLWGIAEQAEPQADPRVAVDDLVRLNRLTGTALRPGETLLVPAP